MIETIEFNGKSYPAFQASGNAARFVIPFAKEVCKGNGLDIGANRISWLLPGAIPIDPNFDWEGQGSSSLDNISSRVISDGHSAMKLPINVFDKYNGNWDYIFSSHCLEHIETNWVYVLDYWRDNLKPGGTLFLYLPHRDQEYWLPVHNKKHVHVLYPELLQKYFDLGGWKNVFISERDLNHSFVAMAQKV